MSGQLRVRADVAAKLGQRRTRLKMRLHEIVANRVWALAARIDPEIAREHDERQDALEALTHYVTRDLSDGKRLLYWTVTPAPRIAQDALRKAADEGFGRL